MPRANHDDPRPGSAGNVALRGAAARRTRKDPAQRRRRRGHRAPWGTGRISRPAAGAVTDSRIVAAQICGDIRGADLLDSAFDARVAAVPLDARDRRWTRTLVYGMLRQRARLDALLDACVSGGVGRLDADVMDLLRLGAYQLLYMNGVPAYAAIGQTVEVGPSSATASARASWPMPCSDASIGSATRSVRRASGRMTTHRTRSRARTRVLASTMARGPLARQMVRRRDSRAPGRQQRGSTPHRAPDAHRARATRGGAGRPPGFRSKRTPLVHDSPVVLGGSLSSVHRARRLSSRASFTCKDPALDARDARTRASPRGPASPICAPPQGGKAAELTRNAGRVFASAIVSLDERLARVQENIARLELANVSAYIADARRPACGPVDFVLIDVHCSGTGTFRRHPDARWRLTASDIPATRGAAAGDPSRRRIGGPTGRPPRLRHLLARARGERCSRSTHFSATTQHGDSNRRRRASYRRPCSMTDGSASFRRPMERMAHSPRVSGEPHECTIEGPRIAAVCDRDHRRISGGVSHRRVRRVPLGRDAARCPDPQRRSDCSTTTRSASSPTAASEGCAARSAITMPRQKEPSSPRTRSPVRATFREQPSTSR